MSNGPGRYCGLPGRKMKGQLIFISLMVLVSVVYYIVASGQPTNSTMSMQEYFRSLEDSGNNSSNSSVEMVTNATNASSRLYLINKPQLCEETGLPVIRLLVMVVTAPNNTEARTAIRETWGTIGSRSDVRLIFILGRAAQAEVQAHVEEEDRLHKDLVQGNFADSYQNLTLKSVLILKWASSFCSVARHVVKIDDDCFLHPENLLKFLDGRTETNAIFGRMWKKVKPIRDPKNKWSVQEKEFPGKEFPDYTGGPTYAMTKDAVTTLLKATAGVPPLPLEDVYITGLCAQKAGVARINDNRFGVSDQPKVCASRDVVTYHRVAPPDLYLLWWAINDHRLERCGAKEGCDKDKPKMIADIANLVLTSLQ